MDTARVQEVVQQVFVDLSRGGARVVFPTLAALGCRLVALPAAGTVVGVAVVAPGDVNSTAVVLRREEILIVGERLRVWSNAGVAQPSALAPPATGGEGGHVRMNTRPTVTRIRWSSEIRSVTRLSVSKAPAAVATTSSCVRPIVLSLSSSSSVTSRGAVLQIGYTCIGDVAVV
jgi:hypothetical protein